MTRGIGYTKHLDETLKQSVYETQVPNMNFLYGASTTKDVDYNIGDRICLPDGRVFRYAKAGNTLNQNYGAKSWNKALVTYSLLGASQVVGDTQVTITVAAGAMGEDADGVIDEDELRGGYIVLYHDSGCYQRGVIGNTALADTGTSITVYLDAELTAVLTSGDQKAEVLGNIYSNVRRSSNTYSSVIGVPMRNATVGQYIWLQTWGPCWLSPDGTMGSAVEERMACFGGDGAIHPHTTNVATKATQHAGFIIQRDSVGSGGPPFIMLQISP